MLDSKTETKDLRIMLDWEDHYGEDVFILPIFRAAGDYGLILVPTRDKRGKQSRGEYTRAGTYRLVSKTIFADRVARKVLSLSLKRYGKSIAEQHCAEILKESMFGDEKYLLKIV